MHIQWTFPAKPFSNSASCVCTARITRQSLLMKDIPSSASFAPAGDNSLAARRHATSAPIGSNTQRTLSSVYSVGSSQSTHSFFTTPPYGARACAPDRTIFRDASSRRGT